MPRPGLRSDRSAMSEGTSGEASSSSHEVQAPDPQLEARLLALETSIAALVEGQATHGTQQQKNQADLIALINERSPAPADAVAGCCA